jgi:hypothetical protein
MIIGFPSPLQEFEVCKPVPRWQRINYGHIVGQYIEIRAPITLKLNDRVWIDLRTSQVHVIERAGIAIWRASWLN